MTRNPSICIECKMVHSWAVDFDSSSYPDRDSVPVTLRRSVDPDKSGDKVGPLTRGEGFGVKGKGQNIIFPAVTSVWRATDRDEGASHALWHQITSGVIS